MDIEKSVVVRSVAGRDAGELFIVMDVDGEYAYLANGRSRRMEKPKKKKIKHIKFHDPNHTLAGAKLRSGEKLTNAELRRSIAQISGINERQSDEGGVEDA